MLVHAELSTGAVSPFWAIAGLKDVPVTATVHDPPQGLWFVGRTKFIAEHRLLNHAIHYPLRPLSRAIEGVAYRDRTLFALTDAGRRSIERTYPRTRALYIPCMSFDRQTITPVQDRPKAVGFFGHVYRGKGFDQISRIRELLPDDISIRIAGRGTESLPAADGIEVLGGVDGPEEDAFFESVRAIVMPYGKRHWYAETYPASGVGRLRSPTARPSSPPVTAPLRTRREYRRHNGSAHGREDGVARALAVAITSLVNDRERLTSSDSTPTRRATSARGPERRRPSPSLVSSASAAEAAASETDRKWLEFPTASIPQAPLQRTRRPGCVSSLLAHVQRRPVRWSARASASIKRSKVPTHTVTANYWSHEGSDVQSDRSEERSIRRVRARAPLRLGLAGGGTDVSPYCDTYGGLVLNATIDRYCYATLEESLDGAIEFCAPDIGVIDDHRPPDPEADSTPLHLHRAIYERMNRDFDLGRPRIRLTTISDAPPGSGLGSSSTLVVSAIEAFREFFALPLGEYDVARLAFEIEREDYGQAGGSQDQYAATFGGFNVMEFGPAGRIIVNPLRIKDATLRELEASIVLFHTGVSRNSADIIAAPDHLHIVGRNVATRSDPSSSRTKPSR